MSPNMYESDTHVLQKHMGHLALFDWPLNLFICLALVCKVWLRNKTTSNHLISCCVLVDTTTHMISVADTDVQLCVNHCEVIVLEAFVLWINVPDSQTLQYHFQQTKIFRLSQQKFRSRASCGCVTPSPHKTMRI
jgi:hypothetical protein